MRTLVVADTTRSNDIRNPDAIVRPAPGGPMNQRRERLLCLGQLLEEIEDERVSLVRPFQRDEVRSARDFNVAGAR